MIATGGGAVVDPANRWALYRDRRVVWLSNPPEVLAQRLRNSPNPRPLLQGRDPVGAIRDLAAGRERFYAPAFRLNGLSQVGAVLERLDALRAPSPRRRGTTLLAADTRLGRIRIGIGFALRALLATLAELGARRAIFVSEPGAWAAVGERLAAGLAGRRCAGRADPAALRRGGQAPGA